MSTLGEIIKDYEEKKVKIGSLSGFFFCGKVNENFSSKLNELNNEIYAALGERIATYKKYLGYNEKLLSEYRMTLNDKKRQLKKWKGNYTLWMPDDSGDEKDQRANRMLKTFVEAVEESNAGYHWDWDESKLKGKKLGLIIRNKFWSFNGKTGFAPEVNFCVTVEKVKNGDFTVPDDYIPNNLIGEYEASKGTPMEAPTDGFMSIPDGIENELPFK